MSAIVDEVDIVEVGGRAARFLCGHEPSFVGRSITLVGAYRDVLWRHAYASEMKRILPILEDRLRCLKVAEQILAAPSTPDTSEGTER